MSNEKLEENVKENSDAPSNGQDTALSNLLNEVNTERNQLPSPSNNSNEANTLGNLIKNSLPSLSLENPRSNSQEIENKQSGCKENLEERLQKLDDWAKDHVVQLNENGAAKLRTGDTISTNADGQQTMTMKNGDVLKVNKDGSYDLKSETGKVKEHTFADGSKAYTLSYPNGDKLTFGNDPVTKDGRIFSVTRNGDFIGIERPESTSNGGKAENKAEGQNSAEQENKDKGDDRKKEKLPELSLEEQLAEEDRQIEEEQKRMMEKAESAASARVDEAMNLLKEGDFSNLLKLAAELEKQTVHGSYALENMLSKKTGMNINFLGGGEGGMEIDYDRKGYDDPYASDMIRSFKTLEVNGDGKVEGAYQNHRGGYAGLNEHKPIDATQAQSAVMELLRKK